MNQNTVLIEINQICNLSCEYCFYHDHGRNKEQMTLKVFSEVLQNKPKQIYITGGEPFLNPNIIQMIKLATSQNIKCSIFTNGIFMLKILDVTDPKDIFENTDRIIISFDSFEDDYTVRTVNNNSILKAIDKVLEYNSYLLEVKICLNTYNIKFFKKTVESLIKRGVRFLSINLIHDIASSGKKFDIKNTSEITEVYQVISDYSAYFNQNYVKAHKQYLNQDINNLIKTCKAWEGFNFVNYLGKTYGCPAFMQETKVNKTECVSEKCINLWEMY
jgi:MoaA/NifB/PqqE/SkfB family radical SAM enzyme